MGKQKDPEKLARKHNVTMSPEIEELAKVIQQERKDANFSAMVAALVKEEYDRRHGGKVKPAVAPTEVQMINLRGDVMAVKRLYPKLKEELNAQDARLTSLGARVSALEAKRHSAPQI
jgi:hypothetical protein